MQAPLIFLRTNLEPLEKLLKEIFFQLLMFGVGVGVGIGGGGKTGFMHCVP